MTYHCTAGYPGTKTMPFENHIKNTGGKYKMKKKLNAAYSYLLFHLVPRQHRARPQQHLPNCLFSLATIVLNLTNLPNLTNLTNLPNLPAILLVRQMSGRSPATMEATIYLTMEATIHHLRYQLRPPYCAMVYQKSLGCSPPPPPTLILPLLPPSPQITGAVPQNPTQSSADFLDIVDYATPTVWHPSVPSPSPDRPKLFPHRLY